MAAPPSGLLVGEGYHGSLARRKRRPRLKRDRGERVAQIPRSARPFGHDRGLMRTLTHVMERDGGGLGTQRLRDRLMTAWGAVRPKPCGVR